MPPLVIAAGVTAAAGIGAAALSSSAQNKAANQAADSAANTAAQNNALQREVYGENKAILDPYVQRGNAAGSAINSLLGIAGTAPASGGSNALAGPEWSQYLAANPDVQAEWKGNAFDDGYASPEAFAQWHYQNYGQNEGRAAPSVTAPTAADPNAPAGTVTATPQSAAFQNYLNSTGYQFQMDQGTKAINQGYAARGALQSGAAMKALQTYGQNTGASYFDRYLSLLGNQQGVGLTGASAVAGVGQNYANTVSANNNNSSAAAQDAYAARGNAMSGLYGSIAGGVAGVANAYGSSYRR